MLESEEDSPTKEVSEEKEVEVLGIVISSSEEVSRIEDRELKRGAGSSK